MSDRVKTVKPAAGTGRERGPAIIGVVAGVALIAVLVVVFAVVNSGKSEDTPAASSAPAASAPAAPAPADSAPPSDAASAPAQTAIDPRLQSPPEVTAGQGDVKELKVTPLVVGRGPKVVAGKTLTVNYVGVTYADGKVFDSSWTNGQPVSFPIGTGKLIKGWDEGLIGVSVGSRVQLDIPADKAYGDSPAGGQPAGDLRFVVDVLQAA